MLKEKLFKSLPTKPTVYKINLFDVAQVGTPEEKTALLQEKAEVKLVGESVNYSVFETEQTEKPKETEQTEEPQQWGVVHD